MGEWKDWKFLKKNMSQSKQANVCLSFHNFLLMSQLCPSLKIHAGLRIPSLKIHSISKSSRSKSIRSQNPVAQNPFVLKIPSQKKMFSKAFRSHNPVALNPFVNNIIIVGSRAQLGLLKFRMETNFTR